MAKAYKYKGVLAQPIGSHHWLIAALSKRTDPESDSIAREIDLQKLTARWEALCDDLNIARDDPDVWGKLAAGLAERHVKGFSRKDPKRRGPKGNITKHAWLAHLVDERIRKGQKNVSAAVRAVAKELRLENAVTAERDYRRFKTWEASLTKMVAMKPGVNS